MSRVRVYDGIDTPILSVIIPAFNEETCLPATLDAVAKAAAGLDVEVIVVDNGSTDGTARVASSLGARVIPETERNIARARNRGAAAALGEVLVFVDADTVIPPKLLARIRESDAAGGAVDTDYRPARWSVRAYLACWRVVGKAAGMAQGATQFCCRDVFEALGGYDETLFMGEDVDFYARLRRRFTVEFIEDLKVEPSCRRFDRWPLWRALLWTNPLVILFKRRTRASWTGWYDRPVR